MQPNTETELVDLERRFWNALRERDVDETVRLSDFPVLLTGPQGVSRIGREEFIKMASAPTYSLDSFELRNVQTRQIAEDVAVVGYEVEEDVTLDGKQLKLKAIDASTWIRRDGKWLCAQHSEALAGDPFGRDRQPAPQREHPSQASGDERFLRNA